MGISQGLDLQGGASVVLQGSRLGRLITAHESGTPFTVLAFNTFEGQADVGVLAELIRTERPDVVSLPEAGTHFTSRLRPLRASQEFSSETERGSTRRSSGQRTRGRS